MEIKPVPTNILDSYSNDLKTEAVSLQNKEFGYRTHKMAQLVGVQESMLFAIESTHMYAQSDLQEIFTNVALECGKKFDEDSPDFDFDKAKNYTGQAALDYLPKVLEVIENPTISHDLLAKVDIVDVIKQLSQEFNVEVKKDLKVDDIIPVLKDVIADDDYFRPEVENLRGHGNSLTDKENEALLASEYLAATGYVNNQMHISKHNGNNKRIDRLQCNPYPLVKKLKFAELKKYGHGDNASLYGVAFEVWKDVKMLKDLVSAKITS